MKVNINKKKFGFVKILNNDFDEFLIDANIFIPPDRSRENRGIKLVSLIFIKLLLKLLVIVFLFYENIQYIRVLYLCVSVPYCWMITLGTSCSKDKKKKIINCRHEKWQS